MLSGILGLEGRIVANAPIHVGLCAVSKSLSLRPAQIILRGESINSQAAGLPCRVTLLSIKPDFAVALTKSRDVIVIGAALE